MSRLAYLDCVGGLSGDMLLAGLLDAGAEFDRLAAVPGALGLTNVRIEAERVERQGVSALSIEIQDASPPSRRTYREVCDLIDRAAIDTRMRRQALEAIERLGRAEGQIHGVPLEGVHFHELGAVDTMIDIVGVLTLLDDLDLQTVACSPLPFARGVIEAAHGKLPLPAPATLALLRGVPFVGLETEAELVTPTGAALAATLVSSWGMLPSLVLDRVGYGAGRRDLKDWPNVVRVVTGMPIAESNGLERLALLETNLDDLNPELVPDAIRRCFDAGALDVWTAPVQMKKGRPGIVLSTLARCADEERIAAVLFEETSALGVRVVHLSRYELERLERVVSVGGEAVRVKLGRLGERVVNIAPEHEDCVKAAEKSGRSVKSVWAAALAAAHAE